MAEGKVLGINYIRGAQILLAILGLIFSIMAKESYALLIILYAVATVYEIIIIICIVSNRNSLGVTAQAIMEILIALFLLIYTIMIIASDSSKDVWLVVTIIIGFILPALFFITAYDKM